MRSRRVRLEPLSRQDPPRIGVYVLLGRLGAGAMGRVYLGRSVAGRLVAVKTIKGEFADEADFRTRFSHEVTAARRVSGAFTAAVVAADPDADVPWLATTYVPAPSLDELVDTCGPLPVPALWWLAAGCAEALESIHQAGLIHRDLKPSNVLVSADGPRVIDFGVARATERLTLTATHQAVGTPAYMAPEQARDTRRAEAASDVFSLGSTLVFAATGHPPYAGDSVTDILVRLATEQPDLSGLPDELTDVVKWCLEWDPRARPTATALLASLASRLGDAPGSGARSEFPAAPLPASALKVIEAYREGPRLPALTDRVNEQSGEDITLESGSLPREARRPHAPRRVGILPRRSSRGTWPRGRGRKKPPRRSSRYGPPARKAARLVTLSAVSAGAVAALLLLGGVMGRATDGRPAQPDHDRPAGPPPGPPPEQRDAPPQSGGRQIALNQTFGDGHTVFVVHGSGWGPGHSVVIRLDHGRASPMTPVVDAGGTFSYAINQNHEFFAGKIPSGAHQVAVTVSGEGPEKIAAFDVNGL